MKAKENFDRAATDFAARQVIANEIQIPDCIDIMDMLTQPKLADSTGVTLEYSSIYKSYSPEMLAWEIKRLAALYKVAIEDAYPAADYPFIYSAFKETHPGDASRLFGHIYLSTTRSSKPFFKMSEHITVSNKQSYLSFSMRIPGDSVSSSWFKVVDGVLHEAAWADDEVYVNNDSLPMSPVVHLSGPTSNDSNIYRPILREGFIVAIKEKFNIELDVPMLSESTEMDQVIALKEAIGYRWDAECCDFLLSEDIELQKKASQSVSSSMGTI